MSDNASCLIVSGMVVLVMLLTSGKFMDEYDYYFYGEQWAIEELKNEQ